MRYTHPQRIAAGMALVVLAACSRSSRPTSGAAATRLDACAAPGVDTTGWRRVTPELASALSFLLPPDLREHHFAVHATFGDTSAMARAGVPQHESQQWFSADRERDLYFERTVFRDSASAAVPAQESGEVLERSDCLDTHSGRPLRIRVERVRGSMWRDGHPVVAYRTEGTVWPAPTTELKFWSESDRVDAQRQTLAIIQSVRFRAP